MRHRSTRRSFIASSAAALAAAGFTGRVPRTDDHDLIIRGGTVFDGTGADGRVMDVAIIGDRIAALAPSIRARAKEEIDARGLAVAPGFIDIHSHGDGNMQADPRVESVIRQGVTTMVVGADGSSRATGAP